MIPDEDLIFLAGIFDSASHFGIKKMLYHEYSPVITITRKNQEIRDKIVSRFGGYCDGNSIGFTGRKAFNLLETIVPFLVNKRAHANILVELDESFRRSKEKKASTGDQRLDEEEKIVREDLYQRMKKLNSKNHADPAPEPISSIFD